LPTYTRLPRFAKDYAALSLAEKRAFKVAVAKFVEDLATGEFRKGLRVKGVQGAGGIFELTWADDGRATFEYGPAIEGHPGEPHIIWRRVGTHAIFGSP
jgi:hypothetical protein